MKESDLQIFQRVKKLLDFTLSLTAYSTHTQQQHAATIFRRRRIIASAVNEGVKTHPKALSGKVDKLHAELAAIRMSSPKVLKGATIIIARSKGRYSRPCGQCLTKIREVGIKEIVYTNGRGGFSLEKV